MDSRDNHDPSAPLVSRSLSYLTWLRMRRVMQKFRRLSEAEVQSSGYSTAQFFVLFQVLSNEGLTQQEVADRLEVTKGNITQLLDKLERDVLLRREREGHTNHLYLTEAGRAFTTRSLKAQEQFVEARMSALSVEEQAQLLTLLRKLERNLK